MDSLCRSPSEWCQKGQWILYAGVLQTAARERTMDSLCRSPSDCCQRKDNGFSMQESFRLLPERTMDSLCRSPSDCCQKGQWILCAGVLQTAARKDNGFSVQESFSLVPHFIQADSRSWRLSTTAIMPPSGWWVSSQLGVWFHLTPVYGGQTWSASVATTTAVLGQWRYASEVWK